MAEDYRSSRPPTPSSGLSDEEARGFHGVFITSFAIFVLIAAAAHFAAWQWRPWIPGVSGYEVSSSTR